MSETHYSLQRFGVFVVSFHFLIGLAHGVAHSRLHIEMNLWQTLYILLVITLLPLISGFLLWRAASTRGFLLLLASIGSHSWALAFQVTAVLLAITEAAGVLTGLFGVLKLQRATASL